MNDDIGAKDALILHLERTLRANRDTQFVDLYKIALNGILSAYTKPEMRGMSPDDWAQDALDLAKAAMEKLK